LDNLIHGALQFSSYVQVVSAEPQIRRTTVVEEDAAFDWRAFLNTTYDDISDPVGNVLTTGNNDTRFKDRLWSADGGVRRDNRLGGNVELFQRLGTQENNSDFLWPNPQATSQLELRYTQPLLNGAGCPYNESRVVLAQIHANISSDDLIEKLQEHLYDVSESYWELYRARADYFQRLKLVKSAEETQAILEGRANLDAVQRQILRARAAVATRQSEIARAHTSIRNAESRLRLLVNDPVLVHAGGRAFAPEDTPLLNQLPLALDRSLYTALQHRPDISQAIRSVRASSVRLGVAQHEVLPKLDLVASTYIAGLASQTHVPESFGSQFDTGRPSYSVGLQFEVPIGRRAALAKEDRRQWEMQRTLSEFNLTVEEALTSVEVAVREVETNYREMVGKYHAMVAVSDEANYLFDRWTALPGADDSAVLLLENLLDAQERVADEEAALVLAQVSYALSIVRLKQEMGTLLVVTPFEEIVAVNDGP
jgi:outer membrane protein TolC